MRTTNRQQTGAVQTRPLTGVAACASLIALIGTMGCGGAGTPGLAPTINRPPDASAAGRDTTIATGRMGLFLTATVKETAPPAADDNGPTSADASSEPADPDAPKPDAPKPTPAPTAPKPDVIASAPPTEKEAAPPETKPAEPKPAEETKAAKPAVVTDATPAPTRAKTTDAAQNYNHIWATLLKVELIDARDNSALTVWEDANGLTLDLQTLHDKNGRRFSLIGSSAIPSGHSYGRVRVTLSNGFELFTPGSTTGTVAPLSDTLARDGEGHPIVSFGLARPRDLGTGKDNLFVDFDLRKLQIDNGRVLPVMRESGSPKEIIEGDGIASQQNPALFAGVVTEWTPGKKAGDGAWTLAMAGGRTVTVQTTGATTVWNDDGKPSPSLANSKRVLVSGRLSLQNNRVLAETVSVYPAADGAVSAAKTDTGTPTPVLTTAGLNAAAASKTTNGTPMAAIALASEVLAASESLANTPLPIPPAHVAGRVAKSDDTAQTITLSPREVGGLVPTQSAVIVQIDPKALVRDSSGMMVKPAALFAQLGTNPAASVRAEGEYETATGTLKATRVFLERTTGGTTPPIHEVIVQGVPAKSNLKNGTLNAANLTEWENIAASDGKNPVRIALTAATELRNESDTFIARENFFKAMENTDENHLQVRVTGTYANGVLTASHIALVAPVAAEPAKPAPDTDKESSDAEATAGENTADAPAQTPKSPEIPAAPVPKSGPHLAPVLTPPAPAPPMPEIPVAPVVKP